MSNKLKLWFDKNINDIKGCMPSSEERRWDIYLLFNAFLGIKILDDNNLITELKNRGYDISTIKFEITKKNSEIQPVTTKDLTLDMWDKSVVDKIKRLEKSVELNSKVKKDIKKQLAQQKAMWNELKEHISNQIIHYDELSDKFKEENNDGCVLLANSKRSMIEEILYKMQELEGEDEN